MSSRGIYFCASGISNNSEKHPHILNAQLQQITGGTDGADVTLADGVKLRTFTTAQLLKHGCCGNGRARDWKKVGKGAQSVRLTWAYAELKDTGREEVQKLEAKLVSGLPTYIKDLVHSIAIKRGSIVVDLVLRDGATDFDALVVADTLQVQALTNVISTAFPRQPVGQPSVEAVSTDTAGAVDESTIEEVIVRAEAAAALQSVVSTDALDTTDRTS